MGRTAVPLGPPVEECGEREVWGDEMMGKDKFFKKLVSANIVNKGRYEARVGGGGNTEAQTT